MIKEALQTTSYAYDHKPNILGVEDNEKTKHFLYPT